MNIAPPFESVFLNKKCNHINIKFPVPFIGIEGNQILIYF